MPDNKEKEPLKNRKRKEQAKTNQEPSKKTDKGKKDVDKKQDDLFEKVENHFQAMKGLSPEERNEYKRRVLQELKEAFPEGNQKELEYAAELIAEGETQRGRGLTREEMKKIFNPNFDEAWKAVDEILSEIYLLADMNRDDHFDAAFDLETQIKLAEVRRAAAKAHGHKMAQKLNAVHTMRKTVHNGMYYVEGGQGKPDKMMEMMQKSSEMVDVLFGTEGVASANRFYEDVLERIKSRHNNWLPYDKVAYNWKTRKSEVDEQVRALFIQALESGAVDGVEHKNVSRDHPDWPEWKINRALHLGRAYGSVSSRFIEITAASRTPARSVKDGRRFVSQFSEDFVRGFDPVEHMVVKYGPERSASFLYYLFSGEQVVFKNKEEAWDKLREITDVSYVMSLPEEKRKKIPNIIWNMMGASSPLASNWRLLYTIEDMPLEERQRAGLQIALAAIGEEGLSDEETLRKKQEIWDKALQRAPLAVLRGVLRGYPELQQEINKLAGIRTEEVDEIENWLFVLKERLMEEEREHPEKEAKLDFGLIKNKRMRQKTKDYLQAIRKKIWEKGLLGGKLEDLGKAGRTVKETGLLGDDLKKFFPFTIAVSDMPFEKMDHIKTGHVGFLARKWRDTNHATNAAYAFMGLMQELPRMKGPDDYKEAMKKIWDELKGFDYEYAQKFTTYMAEMISRACMKTPWSRYLPWPLEKLSEAALVDNVASTLHVKKPINKFFDKIIGWKPIGKRRHSYMQEVYQSYGAAAWDKINIKRLADNLQGEDYINPDQRDKILEKLNAEWWKVVLEGTFKWGPLVIFLIGMLILDRIRQDLEKEVQS